MMKVSLAAFTAAVLTTSVVDGFTVAPRINSATTGGAFGTKSTTALPMATAGSLGCRPIGIGAASPETVVSNVDLEKVVETSDDWIKTRTGISNRHVLLHEESIKDLASKAGQQALDMSGVDPLDIDLVICATSSSDDLFGDATSIANNLGCTNAMAFDLTAACSGFLFSTVTAGQFLNNPGDMKNALVVGADALSRWVDWDDRNSCILFGDGAGAMVLTKDEGAPGVLGYSAHSNGAGYDKLKLK